MCNKSATQESENRKTNRGFLRCTEILSDLITQEKKSRIGETGTDKETHKHIDLQTDMNGFGMIKLNMSCTI